MSNPQQTASSIIPALRYRDANEAIEFLCAAFGFTKHLVVPDNSGGIAHAQLTLGKGMIMLGSARDDEFGRLVSPPANPTAPTNQALYLVVPDADAHFERSQKAGATIIVEPKDEDYGGRGYTCRDPEGHVWTFGTYDPWHEHHG